MEDLDGWGGKDETNHVETGGHGQKRSKGGVGNGRVGKVRYIGEWVTGGEMGQLHAVAEKGLTRCF
jgi:hypothetical protein